MIKLHWTAKVTDARWEHPDKAVFEWLEENKARYDYNKDGIDWIIFDNDDDALIFKLKYKI